MRRKPSEPCSLNRILRNLGYAKNRKYPYLFILSRTNQIRVLRGAISLHIPASFQKVLSTPGMNFALITVCESQKIDPCYLPLGTKKDFQKRPRSLTISRSSGRLLEVHATCNIVIITSPLGNREIPAWNVIIPCSAGSNIYPVCLNQAFGKKKI